MTKADIYWSDRLDERFEPVEPIKTGRMSTLVHAVERCGGRDVALKVLHRHLVDQEPIRRRLRRQLAAVRRLEHPSIIRIYDLIETDDTVALVMEYVDAPSVRTTIRRDGPMSWDQLRPVLDSVLAGLQEAHQKGIWHRDLNAEHIFVGEDGTGRIGGFGLARVDELVALTMHTRVLGALEAMAPERILGMDYDGRADLYSAGAVAYEALVGHPPVDGSMREAFRFARGAGHNPVDDLPDGLPKEAKYVIERSLTSDVSARFATADQMRRALFGAYDEVMWRRWVTRNTEYCPQCESPVIDGVARCVVCDYEFRRLVQNPGAGELMVRIVSPHDSFKPDVWFESNMEPKYLSETQFNDLMELLESHEDTQNLADRDWEYRWPPYVLLSDLTREDARRVSRKLHQRSIPHEITRKLPGAWRTAFSGSGRSTGVMVGIALVLITGIFTAHVNVPVPDGLALAGFFVFFAALLASQLLLVPLKRRLGSRKDVVRHRGHAFMIPTESLQGRGPQAGTAVLPTDTGRQLERIGDEGIRREVFEILVLAVAVAEESDDSDLIAALVEEVLELGRALDEMRSEAGRERTVELVQRLQRIDMRLAQCGEDVDGQALQEYRSECLEALEDHDRTMFDVTMLKARLVAVRGALLDLRSDSDAFATIDDEVTFDFDTTPGGQLENLQTMLRAQQEVEELVE